MSGSRRTGSRCKASGHGTRRACRHRTTSVCRSARPAIKRRSRRNPVRRPRALRRGTVRSKRMPSVRGARVPRTWATAAARVWRSSRWRPRFAPSRSRMRVGAFRRTERHASPIGTSRHSWRGRTHRGRMRRCVRRIVTSAW